MFMHLDPSMWDLEWLPVTVFLGQSGGFIRHLSQPPEAAEWEHVNSHSYFWNELIKIFS